MVVPFADPAVDQPEEEQRAGQPVLEASRTVRGFVLEVQLDAPVLRERYGVEVGIGGPVVFCIDFPDGFVSPGPVRARVLHRTNSSCALPQLELVQRLNPALLPRRTMGPLMDVPALDARLASGQRTVLLDVRWALGDPHGREHYLEAHLPVQFLLTLPPSLRRPRLRSADAIRFHLRRNSRPAPGAGESTTAMLWWPTTTAATWLLPAPGGCCATPGSPRCTCSTAAWPPGRGPACRWNPGPWTPYRATFPSPRASCRP